MDRPFRFGASAACLLVLVLALALGAGAAYAQDKTAPTLSCLTVKTNTLTLYYNEALDETPEGPILGRYTVNVGTASRTATGAEISGKKVALTLASAVTGSDTVTLSYQESVCNDCGVLTDAAGNQAAFFSNRGVTNSNTNHAPVFSGTDPGSANVAPGIQHAYDVGDSDFNDVDCDTLTFSYSVKYKSTTGEGADAQTAGSSHSSRS